MASFGGTQFYNFMIFSSLLMIFIMPLSESAEPHQFRVGGSGEWIEPSGNASETYNEWATRNRFHIGDSLSFVYKNDSVLAVNYNDYLVCNTSEPIEVHNTGNTVIKFDRYGFFYFISGVPGHCESGQKLIIWVMGQYPDIQTPEGAPAPEAGGTQGGWRGQGGGSISSSPSKSPNSSAKVSATASSWFMTALGSIVVIAIFN